MKKIQNLFFLCLIIILSINLSSAYIGEYPKGSCVNVATNLNTTQVNVSIKLPNSSFIIQNQPMTQSGTNFDYLFCNTSTIGYYIYNYVDSEGNTYQSSFDITSNGFSLNLQATFIYLFFLLFCTAMIFYSARLVGRPVIRIEGQSSYTRYKNNRFSYYVEILKGRLFIVGSFGVYLFLLLFIAISSDLTYTFNLIVFNDLLKNMLLIISWGLIPFTLFWLCYLIYIFVTSTTETLKYQLGGFRGT